MKTKNHFTLMTIVVIAIVSLCATSIPIIKKDFVKFKEKLFASRCEVTNKEYRDFLQDLKSTNQNDKYIKCLYDSTKWVNKFSLSDNEPMENNYHSHIAYDNYPIVNITLDAAKLYCEWLTNKFNSDSKKEYKKVLFRLPAETEWKMLAAPLPGHNLPWYGNFPYVDAEGKTILTNIKIKDNITDKSNYVFDGGFHTLVAGHYKPNNLGLYDVIGNVSEMTQDGAQKGGSWDNYLEECTIDKTQKYDLPDPRVGFRIIMEVIEE